MRILPFARLVNRTSSRGGPHPRPQAPRANLAWACARCNDFKGSDIATYLPGTNKLVRLFNPRTDAWDDHFFWDGTHLRANTEIAQGTIALLRLNADNRVMLRQALMDEGLFFGEEKVS